MHKLLNYSIQGEGFPVVFIHGFLEDLTMWKYMAPITGFQSICIDLPGHGLSEVSVDFSISTMATQVTLLLDTLNIDEFHVVGHSMGGYVGLELLSSDGRTQKLVLMNSNFWSDDEEKKNNRRRVAQIVLKNKNVFLYEAIPNLFFRPEAFDSEIKEIIEGAKKMEASTIAGCSITMSHRSDFSALVGRHQEDIFIIQGAHDTIVDPIKMKKAAEGFRQLTVKIVNGGHMSHLEDLTTTKNLIKDFIRKNGSD